MKRLASSSRNGAVPPATPTASPAAAPAGPAAPFTLHELEALRHGLSSAIPDRLYAPWVSAARKVDALLAAAKAERRGMEPLGAPVGRVLSKLKPESTK